MLFEMAEKWLNVPFRPHGRDKNGCDCIGLVIGILYENKIMSDEQFDRINSIRYGSNLSKINYNLIDEELIVFFEKVEKIQSADLLLIKCKNSPIHFAIYGQKNNKTGQIIHVIQQNEKVCKTNFDTKLNVISKYKLRKQYNLF